MKGIKKSKGKRPRKIVSQLFPWSTPETTLHHDAQKTLGEFCGLFSFAAFEIAAEITRFSEHPRTTFFDCVLLRDLPYHRTARGIAAKGTVLRRIEFRQHCSLMLYGKKEGSLFESMESVCFSFKFSWNDRVFSELYGFHGLGYKAAPEVLSETAWVVSLKFVEPQHLEGSGGAKAGTLTIHFPSFEFDFEVLGKRGVPQLTFYTDEKK